MTPKGKWKLVVYIRTFFFVFVAVGLGYIYGDWVSTDLSLEECLYHRQDEAVWDDPSYPTTRGEWISDPNIPWKKQITQSYCYRDKKDVETCLNFKDDVAWCETRTHPGDGPVPGVTEYP